MRGLAADHERKSCVFVFSGASVLFSLGIGSDGVKMV